MTVGEIALIVIAAVFLILAVVAVLTLLKVGRTMDAAREAITATRTDTRPVLRKADATLGLVNTNLTHITGVTNAASAITGNVSGLVSIIVATIGGPAVRAASFTYGVRKALSARSAKTAKKAAKTAKKLR